MGIDMKKLFIVILLLAIIIPSATAVDVEAEENNIIGTSKLEEAVPDSARELMGDISIGDSFDFDDSVMNIVSSGGEQVNGMIKSGLKKAAIILAIVMLFAVLNSVSEGQTSKYLTIGAALAITVVSVGDVNSLVGLAKETMDEIALFSKVLLPTMSAALTASGRPLAASSMYIVTTVIADALVTITNSLLMPLVFSYIAVCTANAALGNDTLGRIASLIKWVTTTAMKVIVVAFVAFIGLTGVINGSADSATIKAAKLALSSVIPVVGSLIADASETVVVSAGIIKNSVGVFGVLCVLAITLVPFLEIGVQYLIYKAVAAAAGAIGGGPEVKLLDNISGAMSMILAMAATCAFVITIACVAAIQTVTG